jgi:peptidoglycan/LPS O-acetylase OafA/YrhL
MSPATDNRLRTLDGYRALAILLVLVGHGGQLLAQTFGGVAQIFESEDVRARIGRIGVQIFFGLSGLLITTRLLSDETQRRGGLLRRFYVRRVFRIMPAALTYLAVIGILAAAGFVEITAKYWAAAALSFANYDLDGQTWVLGHFWSLSVEEHFYFVWPTLLLALPFAKRPAVTCSLMLLIALWRAVVLKTQFTFGPAYFTRTDLIADGLLAGCFVALLLRMPRWRALITRMTTGWRWLLWCALFVACVAATPEDWKTRHVVGCVAIWTIPLLIAGTMLRPSSWIGNALELRPVAWLGRISYSLYLWQQLFLVWENYRSPRLGWLQDSPLAFAAAIACACVSYYCVELNMVAMGHRISAAMGRRAPRMFSDDDTQPRVARA